MFAPHHRPSTRRGFSLLELLVVISLMALLTLIMVPVTQGILQNQQLNSAAQNMQNLLSQARQAAVASGNAVQVRILQLPDYNSTDTTPKVWRGMQCYQEGEPVKTAAALTTPLIPLSKTYFFSSPVIMTDDKTSSTILNLTVATPITGESLPVYGLGYKYVAFRFKPNGETDLPVNATCLTFILQKAALINNGLPANFHTVQIDPNNGSIRSFQP